MASWTPQEYGQFFKEAGWGISILTVVAYVLIRYGKSIGEAILAIKHSVNSNTKMNARLVKTQRSLSRSVAKLSGSDASTKDLIASGQKSDDENHKTGHGLVRECCKNIEKSMTIMEEVADKIPSIASDIQQIKQAIAQVQQKAA